MLLLKFILSFIKKVASTIQFQGLFNYGGY